MGIIYLLTFIALYFLPTVVAKYRKKSNLNSIFIVNLFFGWTLLGWVLALAWAFVVEKK